MKTYAKSIWWTGSISILSFILLIIFAKCKLVYDVSLAVFGSSLVTFIISIIGYHCERKKTLENLFIAVYKKMAYLSHYIEGWSFEKKCSFFINFLINDYQSVGDAYAQIFFFFDYKDKARKYIFNNLYDKYCNMVNFIYDYYISLSLYLDGRKSNNNEIKKDIKEIEDKLLNAEDGSIFCDTMINELHGRYYKIMYNKEYSDNFNKS